MTLINELVANSDILSTKVGENAYKMDEILELLHKHCLEFKSAVDGDRISKVCVTEISDGKGLLSKVYRLDFSFDRSGKKFDIVLKIPTGAIEMHMENENGHTQNPKLDAHTTECDAYELFKGKNIPGMPKVYYTEKQNGQSPGLIIMQNLGNEYDTLTLSTSATVKQCWCLLRLIAKLQASVMSNKELPWKGKFKDQCHTDIFFDTFIASFLPLLLEQHPEFKPLVKEMDCIINKEFGRYALLDRPNELGATSFNHGDMWFNNVFIEKTSDGALTNKPKFVVDWQLVHEDNNPMFDFSRFMTIACDADVRREVQPQAANKFYDMLIEEYAKLGHSNYKPPYSREELQELFDLAYLLESSLFLVGPPFTKVNPTNRNDSANVLEAKIEKMKLRTRLNCEDAIQLIKKYNFNERFGSKH